MSLTHDVRNQVDLGDYWEVVEVYSSLPEDVLKNHQLMNRNSLPSIREGK
ncbi:MAG TPA: hypothetical protein VH164_01140 [Ktedonobacteraceae bacterium]|nr:hypothetical protein [Ktedonobacteraceae bacterium]